MSTATLAYTGPGTLASAVFLIVISNTAFNAGVSLNSAFLSELAKPEAFGKVSGWGWSFGYLGGIVSLAACLLIVFEGQKAGLPADVYGAVYGNVHGDYFLCHGFADALVCQRAF